MKVAYCSDLHLEFYKPPFAYPDLFTDADVLILAGDVCEARHVDKHIEWFKSLCNFYDYVIYVAGNHEFYRCEFNKTYDLLKSLNHIDNLYFLQDSAIELDGITFAGSTLWSYISPEKEWFARRGMNDYHLITMNEEGRYRKLVPSDTVQAHHNSVKFLSDNKNIDVVITHHLPTSRSTPKRYLDNIYNCCYTSNLEHLLDGKQFWIHGHTHDSCNYVEYGCNVLCNPMGYPDEGLGKFELLTFEVFKM